jgi:hypothetical protein
MKGDTWTLQSVSINDTVSIIKGYWKITQDVNIFDSVPQALWMNNTNDAVFQWQFHEKAKKFYINYMVQCEECEPNTLDTLDYLTYSLSGTYDVLQRTSKTMKFESSTTQGFAGKKVQIEINRN